MAWYDLSGPAPAPMALSSLPSAVDEVDFQPNTVRIVSSDGAATTLLVGGQDNNSSNQYRAVVIYISVAPGSTAFNKAGSIVLPSFDGNGVTALSQANLLHPNAVLASSDAGVFKCVLLASVLSTAVLSPNYTAVMDLCANSFQACHCTHAIAALPCQYVRRCDCCCVPRCSISYPMGTVSQPPAGAYLTTAVLDAGESLSRIQITNCADAFALPQLVRRTAQTFW